MQRRDCPAVQPFFIERHPKVRNQSLQNCPRNHYEASVTAGNDPSHGLLDRLGSLTALLEKLTRNCTLPNRARFCPTWEPGEGMSEAKTVWGNTRNPRNRRPIGPRVVEHKRKSTHPTAETLDCVARE